MAIIYACLVCGLLSLMTPAQGALQRLVSVERTKASGGNSFILTARFEADSKPEAMWWRQPFHEGVEILYGSTLEYSDNDKTGIATLQVPENLGDLHMGPIKLTLGELNAHFLELTWNLEENQADNQADQLLALDLPTATINPGTDLAWTAGDMEKMVTVEVEANRGAGIVMFLANEINWLGHYIDSTTNQMVMSRGDTSFMKTKVENVQGMQKTITKFSISENKVQGFFVGYFFGILAPGAPIYNVAEQIYVKVHDSSNAGPFPDTYTYAQFVGKPTVRCTEDRCFVQCRALGNNMANVMILKTIEGGEEMDTYAVLDVETPYAIQATADLSAIQLGGTIAGTYTCVAYQRNDSLSSEDQIEVVVDQAVQPNVGVSEPWSLNPNKMSIEKLH